MKAVRYSEYGEPEVLELIDSVDEPHPAPGELRIAVRAAGVNGIDWKIRSGAMQGMIDATLPAGTGHDAAGVVDELGDGVAGVTSGDRVFGSGIDTFAEYTVLRSWAAMPDRLAFEEAAGYPTPVETAVRILEDVGVQPGQTLLVSGAAGGVGSSVVQLARGRGITVIGTASARNDEYLRSLGATSTIYGEGLVQRVRELAPDGVDAALDIAGSGVIEDLIELTGEPSKVVSIADFSAPEHGAKVSSTPRDPSAAFRQAAELYAQGTFHLAVAQTFPLANAAEAHRVSQAGHVAGRLVVTVP